MDLQSEQGTLIFELRKGGRRFHCRIDAATGEATLSITGRDMETFRPAAITGVRGHGQHEIRFANCDNQLRLWVDDRLVLFDAATTYPDLGNTTPEATDREPVGIASLGAKARLSHLAISRDLYYIADLSHIERHRFSNDNSAFSSFAHGAEVRLRNRADSEKTFVLKPDQFFVLGDNSARSKDGRLWGADNHGVPRELLIGKAQFIYWPHSWNKVPYVNIPCPYFPNFARMRLVR